MVHLHFIVRLKLLFLCNLSTVFAWMLFIFVATHNASSIVPCIIAGWWLPYYVYVMVNLNHCEHYSCQPGYMWYLAVYVWNRALSSLMITLCLASTMNHALLGRIPDSTRFTLLLLCKLSSISQELSIFYEAQSLSVNVCNFVYVFSGLQNVIVCSTLIFYYNASQCSF